MFIKLLVLCFLAINPQSRADDDLKFVITAPTPGPAKPLTKDAPKAVTGVAVKPGAKISDKKVEKPKPVVTSFDGSKVVFGYPRFDGGFAINPGIYSLSQSLDATGSKFNFSNLNLLDFTLSARAFFSPRWVASVDVHIEHIATDATDLVSYQLQDSSVIAVSVNTSISYCAYLGNAENKLCPGIRFGYDNYPVLKFADNTDLVLSKLGDMGVGPNILLIMPLSDHLISHFKAGYSVGLKQGQSAGISMTSDHNLYVSGDLTCPVSKSVSLTFGVGVFSQSAVFASVQDQGTWTMTNLNYTANFGFRYNFNFSN